MVWEVFLCGKLKVKRCTGTMMAEYHINILEHRDMPIYPLFVFFFFSYISSYDLLTKPSFPL